MVVDCCLCVDGLLVLDIGRETTFDLTPLHVRISACILVSCLLVVLPITVNKNDRRLR